MKKLVKALKLCYTARVLRPGGVSVERACACRGLPVAHIQRPDYIQPEQPPNCLGIHARLHLARIVRPLPRYLVAGVHRALVVHDDGMSRIIDVDAIDHTDERMTGIEHAVFGRDGEFKVPGLERRQELGFEV